MAAASLSSQKPPVPPARAVDRSTFPSAAAASSTAIGGFGSRQQDESPDPVAAAARGPHGGSGVRSLNSSAQVKPIVKHSDMPEEMKDDAIRISKEAMAKFTVEKDAAVEIKRRFDKKYGSKWHCIIGRHFASHVSYEPRHYIYVQLGHEVVLLFKAGC